MTKMYSTKRSLLTSVIALMLCFAMLLGTTFAWFTDSVTSAGNKIQSGTLKVDLELLDKETNLWNSIKDDKDPIFNYEKWEPGYTDVKILKIENEGSLNLKWKANFVLGDDENGFEQTLSELAKVIDVYVLPSATEIAYPADRDLTGYTMVGTVADFVNTIKETTNGTLAPDGEAYLGIALKMQETAGNEYQDLTIAPFDIVISATQLNVEEDSFGPDYDADTILPDVNTVKVAAGSTTSSTLKMNEVRVEIPAGAEEGNYELQVVNTGKDTDAEAKTTVSYDINVLKDGVKVEEVAIPVKIKVGKYVDIISLKHNGNEITNYKYDVNTGIISFTTTSFSPFAVEFEPALGIFDEDPALYNVGFAGDDSKYISKEIQVNGQKKWNVSKRATTCTVTPLDSGKLYSIISELQKNEHSTVYLEPGTYNEASTIYIYSSMDIIGLGNAGDVKVVKQSSSNSNRHLFNANGTKADYVQVTLRNMHLDATAKTTGGKDNAAVQSIRKSKVKCYDLTIVKGTGWDAIAFYVNGNNAVDGVKYPAYLYAENCTLNVSNTFNIVSTAGTYKFYHNNLTYGGKMYTNNSGSIKNQSMELNDWEW